MLLRNTYIVLGLALSLSMLNEGVSRTDANISRLLGEQYKTVPPVVQELAQVVWYRAKTHNPTPGAANVYVDGSYHTSLTLGGFTSFCVKPGQHILGAYTNEAPLYRGKRQELFSADLRGGTTYFLRINEQQQLEQPPRAVKRETGENEMGDQQTKRQIHTYSRAASIVPCIHDHSATQPMSHYIFSNLTLFGTTEPGITSLSDEGRAALNDLAISVRQQYPLSRQVIIQINASDKSSKSISERAAVIRNALSLAAIPLDSIQVQNGFCDTSCIDSGRHVEILVK